ncbi:hypothetical protein [Brevibacterium sp. VCM10]|uniref:hypothetical protein n=1 Tax=Brevibacterium sp. VCM10 TaxID=1381751 RepID=UPI0012DF9243|nr:hypothetical protein [Brevibacterium sp. VCM10]
MDIRDASDAELRQLKTMIDTELGRRQTLATAGKQMDAIARDVLAAQGITDGDEWVQPTDATNAYPKDWTVTHDGKTWVSLTPANVWQPGVSGWREVVEEGAVPEWVAPTGAHDAYQTGDHVMFEGAEYVSLIDSNTWSPTAYPQGWEAVE